MSEWIRRGVSEYFGGESHIGNIPADATTLAITFASRLAFRNLQAPLEHFFTESALRTSVKGIVFSIWGDPQLAGSVVFIYIFQNLTQTEEVVQMDDAVGDLEDAIRENNPGLHTSAGWISTDGSEFDSVLLPWMRKFAPATAESFNEQQQQNSLIDDQNPEISYTDDSGVFPLYAPSFLLVAKSGINTLSAGG